MNTERSLYIRIPDVPIAVWFILGFLALTVLINVVVPYPADNDLDEIGWLVDNLSLARPESLANASFPFGFLVLMYVLRAIFGNVLVTALILEALSMAMVLWLVYGISLRFFANERIALLAVILLALLVFRTAVSEFIDGFCVMLLFVGFLIVLRSGASVRSFFYFGVLVGVASLFRYHYLSFVAIVPAASLILPGDLKTRLLRGIVFAFGLLAFASPQLTANLLSHGDMLGHHFQNYQISQHLVGIDWDRFLQTYDHWPLHRILTEIPGEFLLHVADIGEDVLRLSYIWPALLFAPLTLYLTPTRDGRVMLLFMLAAMIMYTVLIILPTRYTSRGLLPFIILAGLMLAPCLHYLGTVVTRRVHRVVAPFVLALALIYLGDPWRSYEHIRDKYSDMGYNQTIVQALTEAGMRESREVYCNEWNMYPLGDPDFVTFYNHGGWLLLDGKYARERPNPERPKGLPEWATFLRQHGLRYMVLNRKRGDYDTFFGSRVLPPWEVIFSDSRYLVVALRQGPASY